MSDRSWVWGALPRSALMLFAVALLLGLPHPVQAQVYTWTDADGNIHYSDVPVGNAKKVDTGPDNAVRNPNFNQALLRKTIPYRDVGGQMHVEGRVNGVPVDFIVDTGASYVVIPRAIAAQADISTEGAATLTLQTANGLTDAPVVRLDHFDVGSLSADGISAVVHDVDSTGRVGLLGMNFLGTYKMTVDHDHSVLVLEPK